MNKEFIRYAVVFLTVFLVLYGGTYGFIGITAPGGKMYNEWLSENLNYVDWLRYIILYGASFVAQIFGFDGYVLDGNTVAIHHSSKVRIVYECLGYGVLSFWIAFVVANRTTLKTKLIWGALGLFVILFSNIIRIAVLLISNHNRWKSLFKVDHHTVYSICNYIIIILLIYLFTRHLKKQQTLD